MKTETEEIKKITIKEWIAEGEKRFGGEMKTEKKEDDGMRMGKDLKILKPTFVYLGITGLWNLNIIVEDKKTCRIYRGIINNYGNEVGK